MKDLNLVPKTYFQRKKKKIRIFYSSIFGAIVIVCLTFFVTSPMLIKRGLEKRLFELDRRVKDSNRYLEIEQQFSRVKSLVELRELEANNLVRQGFDVSSIIEKIETYMPQNMFVSNFRASEETSGDMQITLIGSSSSENEVAALVYYLRRDKYFTSVDISSVNRVYHSDNKKSAKNESAPLVSYYFDIKVNITLRE